MLATRALATLAAYTPPPPDRTDMLKEALAAGAVVAVVFIAVALALAVISRRRRPAEGRASGHSAPEGSAPGHLLTEQERAAEDARVEKELHARALDRKITLGREVDDGILESLTSVAATLESKRVMIYTDPHGYEQLVGQGVASLNRAIRNLRACIVGPESKVVRTAEFTGALERRLADLKAEHGAQFDLLIDEDAVAVLGAGHLDGLLEIAREAVGNALLHGRSKIVSLRLRRDGNSVTFLVQDNGRGFAQELLGGQGTGLARMRAVAEGIGGKLDVATRLGNGTRVMTTVPMPRPVPDGGAR